ncbi:hypothetical protein CKO15_03200 [Halorhodospira abdelmalekii]|nr:hypothetical protein [Halorhodospira abdelmalekii]
MAALTSGPAASSSELPFRLSGFLSQGLLYSSGNNYYGESTEISSELTEVGVNLRYPVGVNTVLAGQIVSRRAGAVYDGAARIDYAFIEQTLRTTTTGRTGVRAGRAKLPLGFFNETRDIPMTRPSILLPQSIYVEGLGIRDFYTGVDGGALFWERYADQGTWQLDLGVGIPTTMAGETQLAFLGREYPGELEMTSGQNLRLLYEHQGGVWRSAATYSRVRTEYTAETGSLPGLDVGDGEVAVDALVLSVERNWERLRIISEGVLRRIEPNGFADSPLPQDDVIEGGYYIQGGYRITPRHELFLRYDSHWNDISDRDGSERAEEFAQLFGDRAPRPHRFFQHQWSLGVGWEVTPTWLLRAEWHHIHGTALTPLLDNQEAFESGGGSARWNLLALQASYQF